MKNLIYSLDEEHNPKQEQYIEQVKNHKSRISNHNPKPRILNDKSQPQITNSSSVTIVLKRRVPLEEVEGDSQTIMQASTMIEIGVGYDRQRPSFLSRSLLVLVMMRTRSSIRDGACWH